MTVSILTEGALRRYSKKKNVATKRNLQGHDGRKKGEEMMEFCQEQHLYMH